MALKHVNAVVIGAGAGGGIVAKELAVAGNAASGIHRSNAARMTCATSASRPWEAPLVLMMNAT
ncbi:MAG: hypothetical protein ABSA70_17400 [Terriglobia bacterium]